MLQEDREEKATQTPKRANWPSRVGGDNFFTLCTKKWGKRISKRDRSAPPKNINSTHSVMFPEGTM